MQYESFFLLQSKTIVITIIILLTIALKIHVNLFKSSKSHPCLVNVYLISIKTN